MYHTIVVILFLSSYCINAQDNIPRLMDEQYFPYQPEKISLDGDILFVHGRNKIQKISLSCSSPVTFTDTPLSLSQNDIALYMSNAISVVASLEKGIIAWHFYFPQELPFTTELPLQEIRPLIATSKMYPVTGFHELFFAYTLSKDRLAVYRLSQHDPVEGRSVDFLDCLEIQNYPIGQVSFNRENGLLVFTQDYLMYYPVVTKLESFYKVKHGHQDDLCAPLFFDDNAYWLLSRSGVISLWHTGIHKKYSSGISLLPKDVIVTSLLAQDTIDIVIGTQDGECLIWDTVARALKGRFKAHKGPVVSLAFLNDGSLFSAGARHRSVKRWGYKQHLKPEDWRLLREIEGLMQESIAENSQLSSDEIIKVKNKIADSHFNNACRARLYYKLNQALTHIQKFRSLAQDYHSDKNLLYEFDNLRLQE